jgi:hypothetical protein
MCQVTRRIPTFRWRACPSLARTFRQLQGYKKVHLVWQPSVMDNRRLERSAAVGSLFEASCGGMRLMEERTGGWFTGVLEPPRSGTPQSIVAFDCVRASMTVPRCPGGIGVAL